MNEALNTAGFSFMYASRNESLTDADKEDRRVAFLDQLDHLDAALSHSAGPFRLGTSFTGIDAIMIPTLERWRYQLPIQQGISILVNRPGLEKWFQAMEAHSPYYDRVAGDEYSWTATTSMFLRIFGGEDNPG